MKPTKNYQTISTRWSMNPATYQNLANNQVDWAAIAQQWIQMKETFPPELVPAAPPPPVISPAGLKSYEEKGEAPMEVEKDDDDPVPLQMANSTNSSWAGNSSLATGSGSSAADNSWTNVATFSSDPQWRSVWQSWNSTNFQSNLQIEEPSAAAKNSPLPLISSVSKSIISSTKLPTVVASAEYWPVPTAIKQPPVLHISSEPLSSSKHSIDLDDDDDDLSKHLDANKRKSLPAWIREGLEKMEKEKLKQEEKEKEKHEREEMMWMKRRAEEEVIKELEQESYIPRKSKFDSDSDDDYEEDAAAAVVPHRENAKHNSITGKNIPSSQQLNHHPPRTRDEIIQELMLAVRKNLTEILLEVTNEEILDVANETVSRAQKKASTAQISRKIVTATSTKSGGLGLGVYYSSDESDSNDEESETVEDPDNDSDLELQEQINQKKLAFEKTTREIEADIAAAAEREERKNREVENSLATTAAIAIEHVSDNNHEKRKQTEKDGETQPHDKYNIKYGRTREKKPSRFSDPRDIVKNVQTHVQFVATLPKPELIKSSEPITSKYSTAPSKNSDSSPSSSASSEHSKSSKRRHKSKNNKSSSSSSYKRRRRSRYSDDSDDSSVEYDRRSKSRDRDRNRRSADRRSSSRHHRSRSRSRERYHSKSKSHYDDYSRKSESKDRHRSSRKSKSRERRSSTESKTKDKKSSKYKH